MLLTLTVFRGNWHSSSYSQCAPAFSNPDQKVHGHFHFYIVVMYKKIQNQLKKTSVIGLPKFTIVNMAQKCHKHVSISVKKSVF